MISTYLPLLLPCDRPPGVSHHSPKQFFVQVAVLLLRGGFAPEWAAIARAHISAGEADTVARQLAGLVRTGRPNLAVEAARALAQTAGAKTVLYLQRHKSF